MSESGLLAPQALLSGRYQIQRCVGKGGMGAVYQATDAHIQGKKWAIKEMSASAITNPLERQESLASFHQEAMILATLDHPNLPKVVDHFNENGKQYLVMDFIEGETLEERLEHAGGGPLPVEEVLVWGEQLCDVLDYLHSRNPPIIFRDLKPGNIMVTPEGTVKLIDFGVARFFKSGKAKDTTAFGTAGYAPKEQYGKGQTDSRSDVYALGATLHYLLSGADPAETPFNFEALQQLNPRVPAHVAATIMKALADTPDNRWKSAAEMRQALVMTPQPAFMEKPVVSPPTYQQSPPQPPTVSAPARMQSGGARATFPAWGWGPVVLVIIGLFLGLSALSGNMPAVSMLPTPTHPLTVSMLPTPTHPLTPTRTPTPTPTPTATPRPTPNPALVDTFNSNDRGWSTGAENDEWCRRNQQITNGKYRWEFTETYQGFFMRDTPIKSPDDFYISVDTQRVAGPVDDVGYGLVFRASEQSFYFFMVTDNQQYHVSLMHGGTWQTLIGWTASAAIRPGAVNTLAVWGIGDRFDFYINGQWVNSVTDGMLSNGDVGVAINVSEGYTATFEFDNFVVGEP
ncbi:MAG TPA: serine/threonine-protein kinase [Anaerolineae bacterium]|nr:serine/threonine-protein kinase [Anaerolineae bacterium]